jgi:hypothetical protein
LSIYRAKYETHNCPLIVLSGREYRSIEPFGFEEAEEELMVPEGGGDV